VSIKHHILLLVALVLHFGNNISVSEQNKNLGTYPKTELTMMPTVPKIGVFLIKINKLSHF
jgi:hypothetical protein